MQMPPDQVFLAYAVKINMMQAALEISAQGGAGSWRMKNPG
jgi:hypothetical protein